MAVFSGGVKIILGNSAYTFYSRSENGDDFVAAKASRPVNKVDNHALSSAELQIYMECPR
jgi:hypothetical protein